MAIITVKLEEFEFPNTLPDNRANFRVVFDIKYWVKSNNTTTLKSTQSIKPGIDTFWEADTSKKDKPNFHRKKKGDESGRFLPSLAVDNLDEWDREIVTVNSTGIHSVRAKVFDVDRPDFWDSVKDFAGQLIQALIGAGKKTVQHKTPDNFDEPVGGVFDEISSYVVKKIAGGGDKVLFQGSGRPPNENGKTIQIEGKGSQGDYNLSLSISTEKPPQGNGTKNDSNAQTSMDQSSP